ncbi:MAG: hypothetical protein HYX32_01920 [Actinobacteria bacterium]|nr:hypothetical protein [Actinomycetota bacterium]
MSEQLSLIDVPVDGLAERPARQRSRRAVRAVEGAPVASPTLAAGEALVEHRYPEALEFLREHGPDSVAVLHVLAVDAEVVDGRLVARASTRGLAERLGFLSKDSAHRRLRQLRRAGVLEALPSNGPMDPPTYVLHLDGTGITVTHHDPSR